MVTGVAVSQLSQQLGSFGVMLGNTSDPVTKFGDSLKDVQEKIKTIEGKTFKFHVDFEELDEAKRRLDTLQKAKQEFEAGKETAGNEGIRQDGTGSGRQGRRSELARRYWKTHCRKGSRSAMSRIWRRSKHCPPRLT